MPSTASAFSELRRIGPAFDDLPADWALRSQFPTSDTVKTARRGDAAHAASSHWRRHSAAAALDAAQAPSKSMIISALPATSDVRFTVAGLYLPDDDDAPGI